MTNDRIEHHLQNWADWCRSYRPSIGKPKGAICLQSNSSKDFDEMCCAADFYAARVTDTAIDNLTAPEAAAVNRKWLSARFNFQSGNYIELYLAALKRLGNMLDKQGLM